MEGFLRNLESSWKLMFLSAIMCVAVSPQFSIHVAPYSIAFIILIRRAWFTVVFGKKTGVALSVRIATCIVSNVQKFSPLNICSASGTFTELNFRFFPLVSAFPWDCIEFDGLPGRERYWIWAMFVGLVWGCWVSEILLTSLSSSPNDGKSINHNCGTRWLSIPQITRSGWFCMTCRFRIVLPGRVSSRDHPFLAACLNNFTEAKRSSSGMLSSRELSKTFSSSKKFLLALSCMSFRAIGKRRRIGTSGPLKEKYQNFNSSRANSVSL